MSKRVIVIGAGMGGLAAALRLRQWGFQVTLLEARSTIGGLASSLEIDGVTFDAGPYVLLDYPGLKWVFENLHAAIPGSSMQILPGAYHWMVWHDAPAVARQIRTFLSSEESY